MRRRKKWMTVLVGTLALGASAGAQGGSRIYVPPDLAGSADISYPVNTTTVGMVAVVVSLDAAGAMQNLTVVQDLPPLTGAATASLQNWTFQAASAGGEAVAAQLPVYIVFNPYNPGDTSVTGGRLPTPPALVPDQAGRVPPQIRRASFAIYPSNTLVTGTVVLSLRIDRGGHPAKINVVQGVDPLVGAAERTVRQWEFAPARSAGQPTSGRACIAFVFQRNLS